MYRMLVGYFSVKLYWKCLSASEFYCPGPVSFGLESLGGSCEADAVDASVDYAGVREG
jgi:hypothetical protein